MNREQMIAWLTLEGWEASYQTHGRAHAWWMKNSARMEASRLEDRDFYMGKLIPYHKGSAVDSTTSPITDLPAYILPLAALILGVEYEPD